MGWYGALAHKTPKQSLSCPQDGCNFDQLSRGDYQLLLHRDAQQWTLRSSANFAIRIQPTNAIETAAWESFYSMLYDEMDTIVIAVTLTQHITSLQVQFKGLPVGLKSVQLQRMHPGQMLLTSPQWTQVSPSVQFPPLESCAGSSQNGDAYWISLRLGMNPELGRMGYNNYFSYGRHGSYREECTIHTTFQGRTARPAVLANVEQFEWMTTTVCKAHELRGSVVPLGSLQDWTLHAARVLFRGWDEQLLEQRKQLVMSCSGPVISVLPGKLEFSKTDNTCRTMFTWMGKATGGTDVRLSEGQEIQILCYQVSDG